MKPAVSRSFVPLALGALVALTPAPHDLDPKAWYFFALFVAVIAGLIFEPLPPAAIGLIGIMVTAALGLAGSGPGDSIRWALSGFSNSTVWLIFGAFMFALGYEKTGLGRRIGLLLVRRLGRSTLGLGYAITFADLVLAPVTPSNTARSAGTVFPVIRNIPALYGSAPGETARKIGAYIMWTAFAATCVTSSMFVTALAPNLLALEIVDKTAGIRISWPEWFLGFLPAGSILILVLPWLIYRIYPPEIKSGGKVPAWAAAELEKMGKVGRRELLMAGLAVIALALWIFGGKVLDATTVAGLVIGMMVVTGIVTWDDILGNRQAWNVLVWFATLVALADGLNKVGFVGWIAQAAAHLLAGMPPAAVVIALVTFFFAAHYMFASSTAHTTAMLPVVLAAGAAVPGVPIRPFALLLCFSLGIMGIITPYATGPAPVYYGSGFLSRRDFWMLGLIFGAIFLLALLALGIFRLLTIGI